MLHIVYGLSMKLWEVNTIKLGNRANVIRVFGIFSFCRAQLQYLSMDAS